MPSTSDKVADIRNPSNRIPSLTLVGAGPGDPGLLTLNAVRAIERADVVLYDALVSRDILAFIPATAIKRSVGKRARAHSYSQDEINELIVTMANEYGHVVRLKGGDPFVFGRGYEELVYASQHGLSTTVIPGVSSALAAPASFNIPVTARGISESVFIVTGTTRAGTLSDDIRIATQSSGTVIILMGLGQIEAIMHQFEQAGKGSVPVAVIENGTPGHPTFGDGACFLDCRQDETSQLRRSVHYRNRERCRLRRSDRFRTSFTHHAMNNLFPVFLKLESLRTVIVGGGYVGLEKISGILKNCPEARITLIARSVNPEIRTLAARHPRVTIIERNFRMWDLWKADVLLLATGNRKTNQNILKFAKAKGLLVNVADTPDLCDFYLGSVVTKGELKVGISTNGKSPTIAKRFREFLEEAIPEDTNQLLDNMNGIREKVKGDFQEKVRVLNEVTQKFLEKN